MQIINIKKRSKRRESSHELQDDPVTAECMGIILILNGSIMVCKQQIGSILLHPRADHSAPVAHCCISNIANFSQDVILIFISAQEYKSILTSLIRQHQVHIIIGESN